MRRSFWKANVDREPRGRWTGVVRRFVPMLMTALMALGLSGARCKRKMKKLDQYRRELWTAEANENLERIYQAMQNLWRVSKDKENFVFPSAGPTPPRVPCGRRPHKPDATLWADPGWKRIGFAVKDEFRYQYQILSSGKGAQAKFTVRLHGDLDCDGDYSTYYLHGGIDKKGQVHDFGGIQFDEQRAAE